MSARPYIKAQADTGELQVTLVNGTYVLAPGPKALHVH